MKIQLSDHFTYRKLARFTLPSIAMMIFTSIYGVVDGLFVSNFAGKTAFSAVNMAWPFLMIISTVGFMFGTGGSALVAKTFGEGDSKKANRYFSLFVYISLGVGLAFTILGLTFIRPITELMGAQPGTKLFENCVTYSQIILSALPFYTMQILSQSFFVTAEKPKLGLGVTVISGCTNMVLDALLVVLLPQEYKLIGAAVATATSQVVGGVIPLIYFSAKNSGLLRLGKTRYDGKALIKACANGSSELMSNISMNLVGMLYNIQLLKHAGEDGVAAYGVMMYASWIFASAFFGYSVGVAPVVGYHDGAKNHDELKNLLKKSLVIVAAGSVSLTIICEILAYPLSAFFVGYNPALLKLTVDGFRIFIISIFFMGFAIFFSNFFTALNDGLTSAAISFLRTCIFQVAAVLILPLIFGLDGIWYSVIVAELMSSLLGLSFLIIKRKKYNYF